MNTKSKPNALIFILIKTVAVALGILLIAIYLTGGLSAPLLLIYVATQSFLAFVPMMFALWFSSDFQTASKRANVIYKLLFTAAFVITDLAMAVLSVNLTGGV